MAAARAALRKPCLCAAGCAIFLALMLVATGCGCGGGEKQTTPATTPETTPATSPSAPVTVAPLVLSGTGDMDTQQFQLVTGLVIFTLNFTGAGSFRAALLDTAGKELNVLSDVDTNVTGSTAVGATAGTYFIRVTASGAWQITVDEHPPVNPQFLPLEMNGIGPIVTPFFQSTGGMATVSMTYSGTSPFIVTLMTSTGETVSTLADEDTGPFNGEQSVTLNPGIIYLIDVEGSGAWTLSVR